MKYFLMISAAFLLCGCQQLILGDEPANDPETNFELFWQDFDRHYGLFGVRGHDWDSIYVAYRPQVTAMTTKEELFEINRQMVEYLDDSHTFIYWPQRAFYSGNSATDEQAEAEFDFSVIHDNYLEEIDSSRAEGYAMGQLSGRKIGYLHLPGVEMEDPAFGDRLLRRLGHNDALIIDLRNNSGGSDEVSANLAGRFADREELVYTIQERNGPEHTDFAEKKEYYLRARGEESFTKPIVVLTDNITVSAAEVMLIYLKALPHVTQIGDATSGDFSDTSMRRFLPNGFQYQYSIMKFLLPDGTSLDGVGHVPDIFAENTAEELAAGNDRVLERAFQFLFEEYGIE
ncbi:S41 family peptidase [Lewinella sp. 4G2]|uniref:S41 family peptidase n=1 Tax=Lewinella sp. 4G2 TaxID=1803372 RepID=UPI0007B48F70|nr:S41 family peptidase [Lewinella sp. 4G2]OAV43153.1 peptidase [Lewinella sp. 4G2]